MNPIENLAAACALARTQVELAVQNPEAATPCTEFNAAQLVGHMTAALDGNAAMFGGTTEGLDPFDPPTFPAGEFVERFDKARDALIAAVSQPGKIDEMVAHPAAPEPMPIAAALMFPTFDMYVHSWDLAQANGDDGEYPPALHETVSQWCQHAFAGERTPGILGPVVEAPVGASEMEQLVAFLGRAA